MAERFREVWKALAAAGSAETMCQLRSWAKKSTGITLSSRLETTVIREHSKETGSSCSNRSIWAGRCRSLHPRLRVVQRLDQRQMDPILPSELRGDFLKVFL